MTDCYSSTKGNRLLARVPAAFLVLVVALFFAAPTSAQDIVYQFTGTANVELDNVPVAGTPLVRIEVRGNSGSVTTGANQCPTAAFAFATCPPDVIEKTIILTSGTIIVDGVSYAMDVTGMTLRRPDNLVNAGDESSFEGVDGISDAGADLEYPGLAIHWRNPATIGVFPHDDSEFFHYFRGDGGVLTLPQTDLATTQSAVAILPAEQNRGGIGDPGYPVTSGGVTNIEIDFVNVASNVNYSVFTGGAGLDFGDAPDTGLGTGTGNYNTLSTDAGASHFFSPGAPRLGALVDTEVEAFPNATATGDDLDTSDDEDGVTFPISIVASAGTANTTSIVIDVQNAGGTVNGWIDWNQNGIFEAAGGEYVIPGTAYAIGTHLVPITIPAGATPGTTFGRFRISTGGVGIPLGAAADGEVEDHEITVLDGSVANDIDFDISDVTGLVQPITIEQDAAGNTRIYDGNPTELFKAPLSSVDELNVTGTDDADTFVVDYVRGKVANNTVSIDAGLPGASPGDTLVLNNGTQDTIHHTYTNATDGTIEYSDSPGPVFETISYSNFDEPIDDNLDATNRIFSFNGSANDIDYDFVSGGPSIIGTSTPTSLQTIFNGPSIGAANVVINGNGGADTFTVEPSDEYPITVNGDAPTTFPGDEFELDSGSLPGGVLISLVENSDVDGVYSFSGVGAFQPVTYTSMEQVNLRFSDPNAFAGDTYPGDYFYPINTETGISVEPYFNWDIDNWPTVGPSSLLTLTLVVSQNADLSSPIWSTTTWEDGVTLLKDRTDAPIPPGTGKLDHFVTDIDRTGVGAPDENSVFPLQNGTRYYWGLVAGLTSGDTFRQIARFDTVQELEPVLDYPDDELTLYDDEILFNWNVASPTQPDVYWRMDLDQNVKASFVGATPSVMGGDAENDNDTAVGDGYAEDTHFDADDLPSPLVWGQTYSWRVATMWPVPPTGWVPQEVHDRNETDRAVTFSEISEFSMVTKAITPTPSYPVGGLIVPTNTPELNWWVGGPFDNLTFDLEIRRKSDMAAFCNVPTWPTGITGVQFETDNCDPALIPGVEYEWRVRSNDGTTTSPFSAWVNFTSNGQGFAGPAVPSYPIGGLEIYTINPTLHWYTEQKFDTGIAFTAHYLERTGGAPADCATIKGDGAVVNASPALGVTQVDITNLKPGATYDWCVTSVGLNGSFESGVATFEVAGGLTNNFPVASWPVGNPTVYEKDQQLNWYMEGSSFDWTSFEVEYCVAPDTFGDLGCTIVAGITEMNYDVTGLDYGDVVTWRVRAYYTSGPVSDWSNAASQGSFTVVGLLSTLSAVPTYPVGDLVIASTEATFSWYVAGATGVANAFKIQYSYAETFPTIGNITIETTTTDEFLNVTDLIPGHTYWWRVAVSNDGGSTYGAWSTVASFSIEPGATAPMPRIGGPTNLVGVATASPTLSWVVPAPSSSDIVYDLRYSSDETFAEGTYQEVVDLAMPFVQLQNMEAGSYYWQVRSRTVDGASVSPYSEMGRFTTTASLSVDTEQSPDAELPSTFELGQNYPNPFNPTTTIEYRMSESAQVTLRVYNMLGQVVKTLVDGVMPAGTHRVEWNATDDAGTTVSTGVYMYRMETSSGAASRTLVLMK